MLVGFFSPSSGRLNLCLTSIRGALSPSVCWSDGESSWLDNENLSSSSSPLVFADWCTSTVLNAALWCLASTLLFCCFPASLHPFKAPLPVSSCELTHHGGKLFTFPMRWVTSLTKTTRYPRASVRHVSPPPPRWTWVDGTSCALRCPSGLCSQSQPAWEGKKKMQLRSFQKTFSQFYVIFIQLTSWALFLRGFFPSIIISIST